MVVVVAVVVVVVVVVVISHTVNDLYGGSPPTHPQTISNDIIETSHHKDDSRDHDGNDFAQICANSPSLLRGYKDATMRLHRGY